MKFTEKLDILMKEHGLNKHSLAKATGVGYTTIDAFYKKGYENMKLSNYMQEYCIIFGAVVQSETLFDCYFCTQNYIILNRGDVFYENRCSVYPCQH